MFSEMSSAGGERQILVDRFDAVAPGIERTAEVHWRPSTQNLTFIRDQRAGQRLDQRRFAGAVVANDGQDLAGIEFEVGPVERRDVAVALDQTPGFAGPGARPIASDHASLIAAFAGRTGRR